MTTENAEPEKKLCQNPSGIPPLSSDSYDETDLNASKILSTVVEGENGASEANRDPPITATLSLVPSQDEGDDTEENDVTDEAETDHHGPERLQADASIPTTDEQAPHVELSSTRGVDELAFTPQDDFKPVSTQSASPQVEKSIPFKEMPPNILKAALQEEVHQEEAPELSEDEKKSDERSVTEPPQQTSHVYDAPRTEQGVSLTHAHSMPPFPEPAFHIQPPQQRTIPPPYAFAMAPSYRAPSASGRRKIFLRLQEDATPPSHARRPSFFFRHSLQSPDATPAMPQGVDRGSIAVSWYEGTTSAELQEHVRRSLIRKMRLKGNVKLVDLRIIDETMDPPEEIVLSPFIPDGSEFLLRFSTKEKENLDSTRNFASRYLDNQIASTAPVSPSAAPSPHNSTSNLLNLSEEQLAALGAKLKGLDEPKKEQPSPFSLDGDAPLKRTAKAAGEESSRGSVDFNEEEVMSMHPDDQIEARMKQLTDLLINERRGMREKGGAAYRRQEKKQVVFVLANYFVLFLSLIAIMAEIQSRAPRWSEWAERNLESVQTCATDQESLFHCISNGDFSGLIASFILWFGRSAATKRFFLFGFDTPKRLWTVVYEALVTAFCWGISYMFIRRGMNPDTRQNFISKYWKDAVYGSLAGFNASFLKAVLKNLIPQEALEDALQERHIKILSFLPSFH